MAFYIIVHHPDDSDKPWANEWDEQGLLKSITTPRDVATRCEIARKRQERIFVHRCAWKDFPPTIFCSVEVSDIHDLDRASSFVRFTNPKLIDRNPPQAPQRGQNFYNAPAPKEHE